MSTNSLSLLLLLFLLAATANARPCKTILYLSSSTTTTTTYFPNSQNPNSQNPSFTALILTTTTTRFRKLIPNEPQSSPVTSSVLMPMKLYESISDSIGERSKYIMSVVGALMFGVGCGALTAAAVFVIWLLCSPRGYEFENEDEEKMGYVTIKDEDFNKESVPLAKEVV